MCEFRDNAFQKNMYKISSNKLSIWNPQNS